MSREFSLVSAYDLRLDGDIRECLVHVRAMAARCDRRAGDLSHELWVATDELSRRMSCPAAVSHMTG